MCFDGYNAIANYKHIIRPDTLYLGKVNPGVKQRLRWNKQMFESYSSHYGWVQCSEDYISEVPTYTKKRAVKAGARKISVMINSSGVRKPSVTQVTGGKVLHEEFLQSY